ESYYSIGGGFVVKGSESSANHSKSLSVTDSPYPIYTSLDLIHYHKSTGKQISEIVKSNELAYSDERTIAEGIISIVEVMRDSVYRGCHQEGYLPGGLNVLRRAAEMNRNLLKGNSYDSYETWLEAIKQTGTD